ncbi:50S ribosomal protein L36 (fragment) [Roseovarius sp. EC-HK134]
MRRTTRQSRCRFLSERSELRTFMVVSSVVAARASAWGCGRPGGRDSEFMVGDTRFELVTPSMSTKCSTTELIAHECQPIACPKKRGAEIRAGSVVYKRSRRGDQGLLEAQFQSIIA